MVIQDIRVYNPISLLRKGISKDKSLNRVGKGNSYKRFEDIRLLNVELSSIFPYELPIWILNA